MAVSLPLPLSLRFAFFVAHFRAQSSVDRYRGLALLFLRLPPLEWSCSLVGRLLAPGPALNGLILRRRALVRQVDHASAEVPAWRAHLPVVHLCRHRHPGDLGHGWDGAVGRDLPVEVAHRRRRLADAPLVTDHLQVLGVERGRFGVHLAETDVVGHRGWLLQP